MRPGEIPILAVVMFIASVGMSFAQDRALSNEQRAAVRAEAQRVYRDQGRQTQPMFQPNRVGEQSVPTTQNGNGTTVTRNR